MPARNAAAAYGRSGAVPSFLAEERYGDFGAERVVHGQWPGAQDGAPSLRTSGGSEKIKKRKSRFGLGALFGKKAHDGSGAPVPAHANSFSTMPNDSGDFSAFRASRSDTPFDGGAGPQNGQSSGHASPMSTSTHAPRMSGASRKNLEELVEQEPEFIAYRYPSCDQRLDLR